MYIYICIHTHMYILISVSPLSTLFTSLYSQLNLTHTQYTRNLFSLVHLSIQIQVYPVDTGPLVSLWSSLWRGVTSPSSSADRPVGSQNIFSIYFCVFHGDLQVAFCPATSSRSRAGAIQLARFARTIQVASFQKILCCYLSCSRLPVSACRRNLPH